MKKHWIISILGIIITFITPAYGHDYFWLAEYDSSRTIINQIGLPDEFERHHANPESFGGWMRNLPLRKKGAPVYLHDGRKKSNQNVHLAIIDIDVGTKDLQQCADAVIRLRAEYQFAVQDYDDISFNFTSGDTATFRNWINGYRPLVNGNNVRWKKTGKIDSSYQNFHNYLQVVFTYAGSYSLSKQLKTKSDICAIEIGDVFVDGGFPGHAVIVVDVAVNKSSGKKLFLLAQSYMPAQDIHILKNLENPDLSPWYDCNFKDSLITPEWTFTKSHLKGH
jgi:hypothetical protein